MVNNTQQTNYTLAMHSPADIEGNPCTDVFALKQNGKTLCLIHFCWSDENCNPYFKLEPVKDGFQACQLPFVNSPFQLAGIVQEVIDEALCACGDEFYACAFVDEDGNDIEHPIDFDKFYR